MALLLESPQPTYINKHHEPQTQLDGGGSQPPEREALCPQLAQETDKEFVKITAGLADVAARGTDIIKNETSK